MLEALEHWLRLSTERIHDQADALTALDRAIGDGDHGLNLDRGFAAISAQLARGSLTGRPIGPVPALSFGPLAGRSSARSAAPLVPCMAPHSCAPAARSWPQRTIKRPLRSC